MAEVIAKSKYIRISPQKAQEIVLLLRGKTPQEALQVLKNVYKRPARHVAKTIASALANVRSRKLEESNFRFKTLVVEQGPMLKRSRAASMGRAVSVLHRTSHIKVILTDEWDKK
ncbi:MAG TPA: 50S ribosomal protein L22 [bacterium]|uniref:Large ribosomal subunit protein uL22 n=1 Tax=candidate division TA06 bacterium ADurb.Bin417 TaxID=1852828 RepID=A0A1V5MIW4_UNCT6|nr:MAG: 50S ribosomal protein L22 [candidate division TA06 bacterium ADurb.Bin417]HNQ35336.1 50S ribosomal protein L22 [bacterium]HNS49293.1 50S ribosomal protein L22 [bacterium]